MRSIESEGDSIDDAIENALRALEVGRDRVEIEIVADATRGLLGFGARKARVRATVRVPLSTSGWADDSRPHDVPRETAPSPLADPHPSPRPGREEEATRRSAPSVAGSVPPAVEARCRTLTGDLLALMEVECQVRIRPGAESGEIVLEVVGDSEGLLIGRRGQTLDALEYVLNRMLARGEDGVSRIVLDVEGYRDRRREYLQTLAARLAEKARQTGRVVTLNPMSPRDRRIVHLALQDDRTVATRSQGDGYYRRMLILPAERASSGNRQAGPGR